MPKEEKCSDCNGRGGRQVPYTAGFDKDGKPIIKFRFEACTTCSGRGTIPA